MLVGQQDGEATLQRLRQVLQSGGTLAPEQRLDLVFLPLMRHERPGREVVVEAVSLARQLADAEQRQTLASLLGLGHGFLSEAEMDALLEAMMSTNLAQRLINRGYEEGLQQGVQATRHAVLRVLARQFGSVPPTIEERLSRIDELARLEQLHEAALDAGSLEDFVQTLDTES